MNFESLASSSAGNAYIVSDKETRILVECGVPYRRLQRLTGFDTSSFAGCILSHEHGDHAKCHADLIKNGVSVYATEGTARFLNDNDVTATAVSWPDEKGDTGVLDLITNHKVDLVINIPKNHTKRELTNGYRIRRWTIDHNIPLITNARLAVAYVKAFISKPVTDIAIAPWQEY